MSDLVQRAKELAYRAHAGQVDKAGRQYIEHVARVAQRVRESGDCKNDDCDGFGTITHSDTVCCSDPSCCSPITSQCQECETAEAVAWLHDSLEDCYDFINQNDHQFFGMGRAVVDAVIALTRNKEKTDAFYYWDIRTRPLALRVKLADIADNSSEERLALLDEKTADRLRRKYAKAIAALTE